jgi:hypothetical protein
MKLLRVIRAVLREIFEEAAYERFCQQHRTSIGQDSYAQFLRKTESDVKVRCC